ncbi:MAG TPA: hypothetical protein VN784_12625 [Candidatus Limnocylindrales bacterium]|nr:hypothetical protein [Candidatus Limnocylindrales bacterium]
MKTIRVQEINEPGFEMEILRCSHPVLVGFLAGWSAAASGKPSSALFDADQQPSDWNHWGLNE